MKSLDLETELQLARDATDAAGELALHYFGNHGRRWDKGPGQIVTDADLAVDEMLHDRLRSARPAYGWLSEERADDGSRAGETRVWVVDPIDGTRAFADGIPQFAISVALVEDTLPMVGVVLNPATGQRFEAVRGGGARLNTQHISVTSHADIEGANLLSSRTEMKRRHWPSMIPEARFTTIGSLAYKLSLIANGEFDGLLSLRASHDWDIAAAMLLVAEAGGHLSDAAGRPIVLNQEVPKHSGLAVASTEPLHKALLSRLETASAKL